MFQITKNKCFYHIGLEIFQHLKRRNIYSCRILPNNISNVYYRKTKYKNWEYPNRQIRTSCKNFIEAKQNLEYENEEPGTKKLEINKSKMFSSSNIVNKFTVRTHTCGQLRIEHVGEKVILCGWLEYHRMNKFIVIRDAYGSTQCMILNDDENATNIIKNISMETVVRVEGFVSARPKSMINRNMATGEIEVSVETLTILNNTRKDLPFNIREYNKAKEPLRLQNRYLDLRFKDMQRNLRVRSNYLMKMREFLIDECGFVDVETPTLFRRTPGGAQEFIVPTQIPGKCYSLVQSPQQFKQMLMVGGIDRYFQIARCYRDEGARSDRQPEFTQLDIEMSFTDQNGVMDLIENLVSRVFSELGIKLPFKKITHQQAMLRYGTDKPDIRYDFQIEDCTRIFKTYGNASEDKNFGAYTITIDEILNTKIPTSLKSNISTLASKYPAVKLIQSNLSHEKVDWINKITPLLGEKLSEELFETLKLSSKNVLFLAYGTKSDALSLLGKIRLMYIEYLEKTVSSLLKKSGEYCFLWVTDFPLFEEDAQTGVLVSAHHPFSHPHPEDLHLLKTNPLKVRGLTYDLVLNGVEVGGGSIRVHNPDLQEYILNDVLKIDSADLVHLLESLKSGCPPHGGIALGLDRLLATVLKTNSIRDVIAFPKGIDGKDLLSGAPVSLSEQDQALYNLKFIT